MKTFIAFKLAIYTWKDDPKNAHARGKAFDKFIIAVGDAFWSIAILDQQFKVLCEDLKKKVGYQHDSALQSDHIDDLKRGKRNKSDDLAIALYLLTIIDPTYSDNCEKIEKQFLLTNRTFESVFGGRSRDHFRAETNKELNIDSTTTSAAELNNISANDKNSGTTSSNLKMEPKSKSIPENHVQDKSFCPYPGLRALQVGDREIYFGREKQIDKFRQLIGRENVSFFIVSGSSGVGKSSFVLAGLLPEMGINDSPIDKEYLRIRLAGYGTSPIISFASALHFGLGIDESPQELVDKWSDDYHKIAETLKNHAAKIKVIVLDQFEEVLYADTHLDQLKVIFSGLKEYWAMTAIAEPFVILTVRSEVKDHCQRIPELALALKQEHYIDLFNLDALELAKIISEPAKLAGIDAAEVLDQLVQETLNSTNRLPLLAATLKELWYVANTEKVNFFYSEMLQMIGGFAGVVSEQAEKRYQKFCAKHSAQHTEDAFGALFSKLVKIDANRTATKHQANQASISNVLAVELAEYLADPKCRILTITTNNEENTYIDVTHEAVFTAWPRLQNWINSRINDERELAQIEVVANDWVEFRQKDIAEISTIRIAHGHRAMKKLKKTERDLDSKSASYLFPREYLECLLSKPITEVSISQRALIGDLLQEIELEWNGHTDTRDGVAISTLFNTESHQNYWTRFPQNDAFILVESKEFGARCAPFEIGKWPITQIQFKSFIEAEDGYFNPINWEDLQKPIDPAVPRTNGDNQPVAEVSWHEAIAFCRWLTRRCKLLNIMGPAETIRLPTEYEWLLAAERDKNNLDITNLANNLLPYNTAESNLKRMIAVGLFNGTNHNNPQDMIGNIWEMCLNKFIDPNDFSISDEFEGRVIRGGSWFEKAANQRSYITSGRDSMGRSTSIGFRLLKSSSMPQIL